MEEMGLMRTRTGWLALLLTAGVVWVPTGVRGQEVPPADPVIPLPLYHDRPEKGGFYFGGEFVFFRQTNPIKHQIIALRGLLDFDGSITADLNGQLTNTAGQPPIIIPGARQPGTFLGTGMPALDAEQAAGPNSYEPGWRLSAGWRFRDGTAVEFSWLSLVETKYSAVASIVPHNFNPGPNAADTFLFAPVFNFPNDFAGPAQKLAIGNPFAAYGIWNGAGIMQIEFTQRFTEYDITTRIPIFETDCCRGYGLIGPRHISLWERFKWRTVAQNFEGQAGQDDVAIYNNIVSNQMWGMFLGLGSEWYIGHGLAVTLDAKVAGMVDIVRELAKYERADFATQAKRSKRDYTLVPELQGAINVWWYPIEGVQIRAGYEVFNFFNTVSSPRPVSFNFGGLDPEWSRSTYRFFDGFNAGIAFIF
jgi:hypothetical protein